MLTRLEAINQMLTAVGEQVILIEVEGAGDYANASAILDAETKKVLAKGWHFNTDEGVALNPDASGRVLVAPNVLRLDVLDPSLDVAQRGGYLYNRAKQTDVFTAPVKVDRVIAMPFEACPYHAQREIVGRACQAYQRSYVGSDALDKYAAEERYEATADSRDAEVDEDDFNMLDNPDLAYLRRRTYYRGV